MHQSDDSWESDEQASFSETLVFRPSRVKMFALSVLSAALAALGVWAIIQIQGRLWLPALWLGTALFGLGAIVLLVISLTDSAYLRISPEGFTISTCFRTFSYRWADVDYFTVASIGTRGSHRMVVFNFSPTYRGAVRARKLAKALSGFEGALPDSYGMSLEELADLLNEYRERYGPRQVSETSQAEE